MFPAVARTRRVLAAVGLALALAAILSACGSSSSASGGGAGSSAGSSAGTSGAQFQARLNLAKCFRAHGVNVPDPNSSGAEGGAFRALRNYSTSQLNGAAQACRQYFAQAFPRLNLSPAELQQRRQQLVKFAECMRSHGVDIPDPSTTAAPFGFGFRRSFGNIDRNSPAFQSALKACASLRPQFGRGGGPGGPGGPPPGGAPTGGTKSA
jgi:hypothetical protein